MTNPSISIIIANYNGEKYLTTCLKSVLKNSLKDFELLIVDDGSTDNSINLINEFLDLDSRIRLIRNTTNKGAAASRNRAIKVARGKFLVFLDNDTEVKNNWLEKIILPLHKDLDVGGVQSLLLDFINRDLVQTGGGWLIPQTGWLAPFYQWTRYEEIKLPVQARNIVAVSAALAIRKEVLDLVGGFDEKEAVNTEDLDLCWRIWISGSKIILSPKSIAYHLSKSVEKRAGMNVTYQKIYFNLAKNSFRSIIKNYEVKNIIGYLPISVMVNVVRGVLVLCHRRQPAALIGTIRAIVWNIININDTLGERKKVQKTRRFSDDHILSQVSEKGSLLDIYKKYFSQTKLI